MEFKLTADRHCSGVTGANNWAMLYSLLNNGKYSPLHYNMGFTWEIHKQI